MADSPSLSPLGSGFAGAPHVASVPRVLRGGGGTGYGYPSPATGAASTWQPHIWSRSGGPTAFVGGLDPFIFAGREHGGFWWGSNPVPSGRIGGENRHGYVNWNSFLPWVFYPGIYGTAYPWYLSSYSTPPNYNPAYADAAYGYPDYTGYPYDSYGYTTAYSPYSYEQLAASNAYTDNSISPAAASPPPGSPAYEEVGSGVAATRGGQHYYADALNAFQQGNYEEAARLLAHLAVEMPRDAKTHELMAVTMLAFAQYRGGAMEAHAALALGPAADWATLAGFYQNDVDVFTSQLRALEAYVPQSDPSSPDGRFLAGYAYLMMGFRQLARDQFAAVVKFVPQDKLAAQLIDQLDSGGRRWHGDGRVVGNAEC